MKVPQEPVPGAPAARFRALLLPLQPTGLVLIGLYAVLVRFVQSMTMSEPLQVVIVMSLSAPLWYALAAALSLYAQKLLRHMAQGLNGERIDDATDLNPFQRPLAFKLAVVFGLVMIVMLISGREIDALWLLIPVFVFPLLWLGVCLEESLFAAFHPARAWRIVVGLGPLLPAAVACLSLTTGLLAYSTLYINNILVLLGAAYLFLLGNLLTGALLFQRRNHLYLQTVKSPEQDRAKELMKEAKAFDNFFHELHRFCMGGHFAEAVARLEAYIGDQAETLDPLIHDRLIGFQDQRLTFEHALQYLHRLAARGERRKAWTLLKWCLEREPRFRPLDGATLLDLTKAASREDAGIVNSVLEDFAGVYPDDALIAEAAFRRARVCIERLGDSATGLELLRTIAREHPRFAASDEFRHYRERLKPR